ncbi:hypothetical protein V3C99_004634 [Haemonchus contortus]
MSRSQLLETLKKIHVCLKRTNFYPGTKERLSPADVAAVMYLHFAAGRGWMASQDEEREHRTGTPIPLLAWSET